MQHVNKLFTIGLIAISSVAFAHGDEDHDKKAGASSHEGHASALGKPGDPTKVSRTVVITMSDAMRFNPSNVSDDATVANPAGTPSGQSPAASSIAPTSTKASKTSKTTNPAKTTTSAASVPARAATTPTLGDANVGVAKRGATSSKPAASAKPTSQTGQTSATGSAEIVFETALPATDPQAPASTKKSGKPGSKATTSSTAPKTDRAGKPDPSLSTNPAPTAAAATVAIAPALPEPTRPELIVPEPTLPPAVAPTTTKRPKPTTTTTTILLSPDTVPASDIEVSVEGSDGSTVRATTQTGNTDPSTTRKKRPSITDVLEGTTIATNPSASSAPPTPPSKAPNALGDPVATSVEVTILPATVTVAPEAPAISDPSETKPSGTKSSVADRPKTEAEIVSGTAAISPEAADTGADPGSSSSPQASVSSSKPQRLRGPLKLAGAGALAALLLGLAGLFASLRAPITAFARQRLLNGFGVGLVLAILTIAAIALTREFLNTPRSLPRLALKGLGFSALTAFAFVRRRSMKRGLSVLSEVLPAAKNVRVRSSTDAVVASRELDEQVPKSLRLGDATGRRAKGRHIPELVRRLRKASLFEAIFGAIALLVAAVLLFV